MLTLEQIISAAKEQKVGYDRSACEMLDGRDLSRLLDFVPSDQWESLGFKLTDGAEQPEIVEWTKENVMARMAADLAFAFSKALDKRGISSSLMYSVMKMWMWVLEDDLASSDQYPMYGLPLYKAIAEKYGLPNEIGDDSGSEPKYNDN